MLLSPPTWSLCLGSCWFTCCYCTKRCIVTAMHDFCIWACQHDLHLPIAHGDCLWLLPAGRCYTASPQAFWCSHGTSLQLITSTALYQSKQACSVALLPVLSMFWNGLLRALPNTLYRNLVDFGLPLWLAELTASHILVHWCQHSALEANPLTLFAIFSIQRIEMLTKR